MLHGKDQNSVSLGHVQKRVWKRGEADSTDLIFDLRPTLGCFSRQVSGMSIRGDEATSDGHGAFGVPLSRFPQFLAGFEREYDTHQSAGVLGPGSRIQDAIELVIDLV